MLCFCLKKFKIGSGLVKNKKAGFYLINGFNKPLLALDLILSIIFESTKLYYHLFRMQLLSSVFLHSLFVYTSCCFYPAANYRKPINIKKQPVNRLQAVLRKFLQ
jgi:hypothetical protein